MNLKYKLLWVDDNKDEFQDEIIVINNYIADLFFEPEIDFCESIEEAQVKIRDNKYDVIFSDYNIDEFCGDDFIESIRNSSVNTEILFYTGQSADLPKKQFDRVTFFKASQPTRWPELLIQKMKDVISLSVEKLQDLISIRGLVMAEVSDLDVKMTEIIEEYYKDDSNEKKRKEFNKHIVKNAEKTLRGNFIQCERKVCSHVWNSKTVEEILEDLSFDSSFKARTINLIINKLNFAYSPKVNNFYEDYLVAIIKKRNMLAHCNSFFDKELKKELLITKEENKTFSEEDFKVIRKDIIKYSKIFDEIYKIVKR